MSSARSTEPCDRPATGEWGDLEEMDLRHAISLQQSGRVHEAESVYRNLLSLFPNHPEALHLFGLTAMQSGEYQRAVRTITRATALQPNNHTFLTNQGNALKGSGDWRAALASYSHAIVLSPDYAESYANRANLLADIKHLKHALAAYKTALYLRPDSSLFYYNQGVTQIEVNEVPESLKSFEAAICLSPSNAAAYCHRGHALRRVGRISEAVISFDYSNKIDPTHAQSYLHKGLAQSDLENLPDAVASYDVALRLDPTCSLARWNRSLALLKLGNYEAGWAAYESRWEILAKDKLPQHEHRAPLWLGQTSLEGKTILLHSEQGFGDTIQFFRFVPLVAALGARVIVEAPGELIPLLKPLAPEILWVEKGKMLPRFDLHCPLLSLPLAFRTTLETIPFSRGYLQPRECRMSEWRRRLGPTRNLRVGLCWSGSTSHPNDHERSIPLSKLLQFIPEGFEYISLQKEVRIADADTLRDTTKIGDFSQHIRDFSDTAALCMLMDLVISVDTSVAHLAGALGKATWLLLPRQSDWRWLQERDDSPWYSSIRLYRLMPDTNWDRVLERAARDLLATDAG